MDVRLGKGQAIAKTSKLRERNGAWLVPSQSGHGKGYLVTYTDAGYTCSCPDWEYRRRDCKHILAVCVVVTQEETTTTNETAADGTQATTTKTRRTAVAIQRPTYKQDWPAYNAAQMEEKATFQRGRHSDASRERHWLSRLNELWNADKHRTITVVRVPEDWHRARMWIRPDPLIYHTDDLFEKPRPVWWRKAGPMQHDTEPFGRWRIDPKPGVFRQEHLGVKLHVDVKLDLSFDVCFEDGPWGFGQKVVPTLRDFLNRATALLAVFQP